MADEILSVVGTDGHTVIQNKLAQWKIWALYEIYMGKEGENRYVPNVKDFVYNTETYEQYKVVAIDPTTLIPTLIPIIVRPDSGEFDGADQLLGVGPGTQSDTYRIYIDDSVVPHVMTVDVRLKVAGTMTSYAKIFIGSEVNGTARVISAYYDQAGNMLGQNVPLELAAGPDQNNHSIKVVRPCYTTEKVKDNEILTAVFYSDEGRVVSKRQLLAENTAFIRSTDASQKYVTDISLKSDFLSTSDPLLLEYPMNVNLEGFNLFGVVHYSNGDKLEMPVDNTKFSLYGLESFVGTQIGQRADLVLNYNLSPGEIAYGDTSTVNGTVKFKNKNYKLITVKADNSYTVKLYAYPVWLDEVNGYRLNFFMLDLNRALCRDVTPYVRFNENTPAFRPKDYGINQLLSISINLQDVDGTYKSYIHTQTLEMVLTHPGSDRSGTNWTIAFQPGQNPPFGRTNYAVMTYINQNLKKLKLNSEAPTQAEWLERKYWATKPLFDPAQEATAPLPNMFALMFGTTELQFSIDQWKDELEINRLMKDSDTLFIKFFRRVNNTDLVLSVSAMPIYQQN